MSGDFNYDVIARLWPGMPASKALSELNVVQAAISSTLSEKLGLRASLTPLQEEMVGQARRGLLVVMAAVGAVLIVLCVNLANLSLARAAGRARDSAIRAALGASRSRRVCRSCPPRHPRGPRGRIALRIMGLRDLCVSAVFFYPRLSSLASWRWRRCTIARSKV